MPATDFTRRRGAGPDPAGAARQTHFPTTTQRHGAPDGSAGSRRVPEAEPAVLRRIRRSLREIFVRTARRHAIPIAERQIITLREKNADLEARIASHPLRRRERRHREKLHRHARAVRRADLDTTLAVLYESLKEDFGVPQVARVCARGDGAVVSARARRVQPGAARLRRALGAPYCGARRVRGARLVRRAGCVPVVRVSCRCAPRTPSADRPRERRSAALRRRMAPSISRGWASSPAWRRRGTCRWPDREPRSSPPRAAAKRTVPRSRAAAPPRR